MNINNKPGENHRLKTRYFRGPVCAEPNGPMHLNFDSCDWVCLLASPS